MAFQHILYAEHGGIARLTLNRPGMLNSLTAAMHVEQRAAMSAAARSASFVQSFRKLRLVPDAGRTWALRSPERFADGPTRGLAATKRLLQASWQHTLDEQLDAERDTQRELGRSADYAEGVAAFMAKRAPRFTGR